MYSSYRAHTRISILLFYVSMHIIMQNYYIQKKYARTIRPGVRTAMCLTTYEVIGHNITSSTLAISHTHTPHKADDGQKCPAPKCLLYRGSTVLKMIMQPQLSCESVYTGNCMQKLYIPWFVHTIIAIMINSN
jgi:hypothetical protein